MVTETREEHNNRKKAELPEGSKVPWYKVKKNVIIASVVGGLLLATGGSYLGYQMFYETHFASATTINGVTVGNLNTDDAYNKLIKAMSKEKITIKDSKGVTHTISKKELMSLSKSKLNSILKSKEENSSVALDKLHQVIPQKLATFKLNDGAKDSKDAYIKKDTSFKLIPEEYGTKVDINKLTDDLIKKVSKGKLDYNVQDYYIKPKLLKTDKTLNNKVTTLNKQLNSKITVKVEDRNIEMPKDVALASVTVSGIDAKQVGTWVNSLNNQYSTAGKGGVEFHKSNGGTVIFPSNDFGWSINVDSTSNKIANALKEGATKTIEVDHSGNGYGQKQKNASIGGDYVEVSISQEHEWIYRDGKLVFDTPIMSGNTKNGTVAQGGDGTDPGIHKILYKQRDTHLKGKNDDGTDYDSPVKYWVPFTYNGQGLHDSPWQASSFYGNHSLNTAVGSHGCINNPPSVMGKVFDLVYTGMPVVVYN